MMNMLKNIPVRSGIIRDRQHRPTRRKPYTVLVMVPFGYSHFIIMHTRDESMTLRMSGHPPLSLVVADDNNNTTQRMCNELRNMYTRRIRRVAHTHIGHTISTDNTQTMATATSTKTTKLLFALLVWCFIAGWCGRVVAVTGTDDDDSVIFLVYLFILYFLLNAYKSNYGAKHFACAHTFECVRVCVSVGKCVSERSPANVVSTGHWAFYIMIIHSPAHTQRRAQDRMQHYCDEADHHRHSTQLVVGDSSLFSICSLVLGAFFGWISK